MAEKSAVRDIAREAESVVVRLERNQKDQIILTTSQIRKFLVAVNALTNKITVYRSLHEGAMQLSPILASEVKYLKVKLIYQVGREQKQKRTNPIKDFVEKARLKEWIDGIDTDIRAYEEFAHYVEALVAYHKYHGGRD